MAKNFENAKKIVEACERLGWNYEVRGGDILTITKRISGNEEFMKADAECYFILSLVPTTSPGSVWGTSDDGVGIVSAVNLGVFKMNKSGCSKRVLNILKDWGKK